MNWILEAAAGLCLLYYGALVAFMGFSFSFSLFWPLCAAVLGLFAVGRRYYAGHREQISVWAAVAAVTTAGAVLAVLLTASDLIVTGILTSTKNSMDYVIVLGAKVEGREPSRTLKKRLDQAIEYA